MPPCNALFLINPPLTKPVVKPFKGSKGGVFGFDQQKKKNRKRRLVKHTHKGYSHILRVCESAAHT